MSLRVALTLTGDEGSNYKNYDADLIREDMKKRGGVAIIPTKRNKLVKLHVDCHLLPARHGRALLQ